MIKHEPPELQLGDGSDVIPATPQDDADDVDEEAEANEQNSTGVCILQSDFPDAKDFPTVLAVTTAIHGRAEMDYAPSRGSPRE